MYSSIQRNAPYRGPFYDQFHNFRLTSNKKNRSIGDYEEFIACC